MTSLGMFDFDSGHCMLKKKLKISFETLIEIVTRQDHSFFAVRYHYGISCALELGNISPSLICLYKKTKTW